LSEVSQCHAYVDRRGVHIEQCQGCRGIFLDRGELEQIANAEQSYYGPPGPPSGSYYSDSPPPYGSRPDDDDRGYDSRFRGDHHRDSHQYGHKGHKRRKGFLEEFLD
jgi:Zn-finger nucleic acid-binding protein